jgi:hypothetical protein
MTRTESSPVRPAASATRGSCRYPAGAGLDAHVRPADETVDDYPEESLAEWHARHKLTR